MSAKVDAERAEASREAQLDGAEERMRRFRIVITAFREDLTMAETIERLGCSRTTVWKYRVQLGLETGRAWRGGTKRTGRLSTKRALQAVRP